MHHYRPTATRRAWLIAAVALLPACTQMDRSECLSADWRTVGYEDGARGRPANAIGRYREDCAEHGVRPDLDAWTRGREAGLREYCRPQNAYRLGLRGQRYRAVCPPDLDQDFRAAWNAGREVHDLRDRIAEIEAGIETNRGLREERNAALAGAEAALIADGVSTTRRAALLRRVRELEAEIDDLERESGALQRERASERMRLQRLEDRARW